MKFFRILLILFTFIIFSCQNETTQPTIETSSPSPSVSSSVESTPTPTPTTSETLTPVPTSTPTPTPIPTPIDDLKKTVLTVEIVDKATKTKISGAKVEISTLDEQETYSKKTTLNGSSIFDLRQDIYYNVNITANNYKNFSVKRMLIKTDLPFITIELTKLEIGIKGKILSSDTKPVESAIIQIGSNIAITDANGNFSITANGSNLSLNISKTGYDIKKIENINVETNNIKDIGSIVLTTKLDSPVILFDTSKKPFGVSDSSFISSLSELSNTLIKNGFETKFESLSSLENLNDIDIITIVSPSIDYTSNELNILNEFIKSGKKVIILGEWGGFGYFNATSLNKLLEPAKLKIDLNLIKESNSNNYDNSQEKLLVSNFDENHFITKNMKPCVFYSSASVSFFSTDQNSDITKLIAFTSDGSFQIKTIYKSFETSKYGLIGVSNIGFGKVIVIGDSSFMLNDDSNKNGTKNIDEGKNKLLALNIFKW